MQKIYTKRESARVDNPPRFAKLVHQKTHIVYEVDVLLILTFLQYDLTPSLASAISPSPFASYGQRPFWPWRIAHSVNNVQKKDNTNGWYGFNRTVLELHNTHKLRTRLHTTKRRGSCGCNKSDTRSSNKSRAQMTPPQAKHNLQP